jgi:SpoVK/Ycf46/Vps4 family AAA+-type ATPase
MFLTTNRIGTFDEAIISRIHVIIHFPDLTDTDREKIWQTSFRKLRHERPDVEIDMGLTDLVYRDEFLKSLNWNGREIRHAFNTMLALAERDARQSPSWQTKQIIEIRREHLREVAEMSHDFKMYLKKVRGLDEAAYARARELRDDTFVPAMANVR